MDGITWADVLGSFKGTGESVALLRRQLWIRKGLRPKTSSNLIHFIHSKQVCSGCWILSESSAEYMDLKKKRHIIPKHHSLRMRWPYTGTHSHTLSTKCYSHSARNTGNLKQFAVVLAFKQFLKERRKSSLHRNTNHIDHQWQNGMLEVLHSGPWGFRGFDILWYF